MAFPLRRSLKGVSPAVRPTHYITGRNLRQSPVISILTTEAQRTQGTQSNRMNELITARKGDSLHRSRVSSRTRRRDPPGALCIPIELIHHWSVATTCSSTGLAQNMLTSTVVMMYLCSSGRKGASLTRSASGGTRQGNPCHPSVRRGCIGLWEYFLPSSNVTLRLPH